MRRRSIFARFRTVPPMPTSCPCLPSSVIPASAIDDFTALRSARISTSSGGSDVRKASLTRSDPSGIDQECTSRRSRNDEISALPPPTSNVHPLVTGRSCTAPKNPSMASWSPSIVCSGTPSRWDRSISSCPSTASRTADVATRDHLPRAGALGDRDEVAQRLERALDRIGAEPVGVAQLASQAQRGTRVLDHVEVLALPEPEHDHAPGVRAEVDDGEGSVVGCRIQDRAPPPMLPHHGCRTVNGPPTRLTRRWRPPDSDSQMPTA